MLQPCFTSTAAAEFATSPGVCLPPSSPCLFSSPPFPYPLVMAAAHQFAATISHFGAVFFCSGLCAHCGSRRMKDVSSASYMRGEDDVFLRKIMVLKYCLSGLPTSMQRLGFVFMFMRVDCSWILFCLFLLLYVVLLCF